MDKHQSEDDNRMSEAEDFDPRWPKTEAGVRLYCNVCLLKGAMYAHGHNVGNVTNRILDLIIELEGAQKRVGE